MSLQKEIDALEKRIANLNVLVGSSAIKEALSKQLLFLRSLGTSTIIDSSVKEESPITQKLEGENAVNIYDVKGTALRVNGKTIFLPENLQEEAEQIFSRVKDSDLQAELVKDYYSMHLQQYLENKHEGARLAHKQIENIINCSLGKENVLNKIKKYEPLRRIWYIQFSGGQGKKHPAEIAYGEASRWPDSKWPSKETLPDDGLVSFTNKAILYFAYCSSTCEQLKDGLRNGMIDNRLFSQIYEIKNLRDVASHGFALRQSKENSLLKCTNAEAFSRMRSTLQIFRNTMPNWL